VSSCHTTDRVNFRGVQRFDCPECHSVIFGQVIRKGRIEVRLSELSSCHIQTGIVYRG
jgi:hypothetical protein